MIVDIFEYCLCVGFCVRYFICIVLVFIMIFWGRYCCYLYFINEELGLESVSNLFKVYIVSKR